MEGMAGISDGSCGLDAVLIPSSGMESGISTPWWVRAVGLTRRGSQMNSWDVPFTAELRGM